MVHNHDIEFEQVFGGQTVFDILMANTDPKNVVFQLDIYWATNGGGLDNPLEVIERYGNRIQLFHVKDMAPGRSRAGSRSSARASSTSRRSSRPPGGPSSTTWSSTTRASAIPPSTRSRRPRRALTTSTA